MTPRSPSLLPVTLLAATLFSACPGGEEAAAPAEGGPVLSEAQTGALHDSWMVTVLAQPELLGPFEQGRTGDAWLGFFHNDLRAALRTFEAECKPSAAPAAERAAAGFPCVGAARAHLELAELFATTAEIERVARRQFYKHRRTHAEDVLASTQQGFFEGVTLIATESAREQGRELLTAYVATPAADPLLKALGEEILAGLGNKPLVDRLWGGAAASAPAGSSLTSLATSGSKATNYAARLAFASAVAIGDLAGAEAVTRAIQESEPDFQEQLTQRQGDVETKVDLAHGDPVYQRARSWFHAQKAVAAIGGATDYAVLTAQAEVLLGAAPTAPVTAPALPAGLELVLFSSVSSPADLASLASKGGTSPTLHRLSGEFKDLADPPKKELADLDVFVDLSNSLKATLEAMIRGMGDGPANMAGDMGVSHRFHTQLLQERAEDYRALFDIALDEDVGEDVASAGVAVRALLELGLDKTPQPPSQQLKRARISFRNDPPFLADLGRANLDTRRPYDANEYIRPLTEVYVELIPVREALSALDSAWNPARKGSVR